MSTPASTVEASSTPASPPEPDKPQNGDTSQAEGNAYARLPQQPDPALAVMRTVGTGLGDGLRRASRALEAGAVSALLGDTNLPEIHADDAIAELATRVDREADLWRNLALRELTRLTFTDRIVQGAAVVALLGQVGIAVVAGLGVLFGGESAGLRALLALAASFALALGVAGAAWAAAAVRRAQREISRDALLRADLAELRLHRLALALSWRARDPARYAEAVARLERDASR